MSAEVKKPTLKEQGYFPQRYVVAFMAFWGQTFTYMLRTNINIAIVGMVKPLNDTNNSTDDFNECGYEDEDSSSTDENTGDFEWDEFEQSLVLGAFFWGYIWTQIPGGRLAERIGARRMYAIVLTGGSLITLLIPVTAHWSYVALIVLRVMLGLCQGPTFPSTHVLLSSWAPPNERSILSSMVYAGGQAGTIIGYPMAAPITDNLGWEAVFYIQPAIVLVWVVLWLFLTGEGPQNSRWISKPETEYILNSIGDSKERKKAPPVPWVKVWTSLPLWAILIAGLGNNWGFYTLLTDLPLYMKEILKQDINSNALLSGMPYLGMLISSIFMGHFFDALRQRGIMSTGTVRKTANSIAHIGPAICLISLSFVECDRTATIVLLFVAVALQGGIYSGFMVNHIDIAPNYAGTLFGITNAAATIPGWVAPMTVGALTNGQQTNEQWRKVFYIAAAFYIIDAVFFIIFASGVEQPWNRHADVYNASGEKNPHQVLDKIETISTVQTKGERETEGNSVIRRGTKDAQLGAADVYDGYVQGGSAAWGHGNPAYQKD